MRNRNGRQRRTRVDTSIPATVTDSEGVTVSVTVMDISREGCRLRTLGELHAGEQVRINIDRYGSYPVEIKWAKGDEAGAVFLEPVVLP